MPRNEHEKIEVEMQGGPNVVCHSEAEAAEVREAAARNTYQIERAERALHPVDVPGAVRIPAPIFRALGAMPYSTDDERYSLQFLLIDGDRAVATDGHRLAVVTLPNASPRPILIHFLPVQRMALLMGREPGSKFADDVVIDPAGSIIWEDVRIEFAPAAEIMEFPDWRKFCRASLREHRTGALPTLDSRLVREAIELVECLKAGNAKINLLVSDDRKAPVWIEAGIWAEESVAVGVMPLDEGLRPENLLRATLGLPTLESEAADAE